VAALPTHRLTPAHDTIVAVSVDDGDPVIVDFDRGVDDENDPTWQRNVLRSAMLGTVELQVPARAFALKLWAADPAVVVHRITIEPGAS
jgi:hypothetical protein